MSDLVKLPDAGAIEQVLIAGDLSKLTVPQRTAYYISVCQSVGLNHLTQPFQYLVLNGKLQLYARKDCTDQLRTIHNVSIVKMERETIEGVFVCTAYAVNGAGRQDVSTGAVAIDGLKGEARANAMMKAETKSKRRATLSICGLGMLDETEIETIPNAQAVETPAALPATSNGNGKRHEQPKAMTWAEAHAQLCDRIKAREAEFVAADKCESLELQQAIEGVWAHADLPDNPAKLNQASWEEMKGLAKSVIEDFDKRSATPTENLDADPVDAEPLEV